MGGPGSTRGPAAPGGPSNRGSTRGAPGGFLPTPGMTHDCTQIARGACRAPDPARYKSVMLWFFKAAEGPPRFIGIHCDSRPETCELVVLYPDGSEESEHYDDLAALTEAARKLGRDLVRLGWEPCPTAATPTRRES